MKSSRKEWNCNKDGMNDIFYACNMVGSVICIIGMWVVITFIVFP